MFFPVLDHDSKLKLPFSKVSSQREVVKMTMFAVHPMTASLSALLCLEMTCWLLRLPQGLSFCGGGTDRLPPYLATVPVTLCQLPSLKNHPGTMVWVMSTLCFVGGGSPGKNTISQVSGQENKMVPHVFTENTGWTWQVIFHLCCRLYSLGGNVGLLHGVGLLYNYRNKAYRRKDQNKPSGYIVEVIYHLEGSWFDCLSLIDDVWDYLII